MVGFVRHLAFCGMTAGILYGAFGYAQSDDTENPTPEMPTGEPESEQSNSEANQSESIHGNSKPIEFLKMEEGTRSTDDAPKKTILLAPADMAQEKNQTQAPAEAKNLNPDSPNKPEAWIKPVNPSMKATQSFSTESKPSIVIEAFEQQRRPPPRIAEEKKSPGLNKNSPNIDTPLIRDKKRDPGNFYRTSGRNNYRSAKIKSHATLKRLRDVHGVKTIINLAADSMRDQKDRSFGCHRRKYCEPLWSKDLGLNYVSVYLGAKGPSDEKYAEIKRLLEKGDVLVHCRHGADRTGAVLGRYRLEKGEINKTEALSEALSMGFKPRTHPGYGKGPDPNRHLRAWMLGDEVDLFHAPFAEFIMKPNAKGSGSRALGDNPGLWDKRFYNRVADASYRIAGHAKSWKRLESSKDDFVSVLKKLRKKKLPEVFAAIPLQETRYIKGLSSPTCAGGIWQIKPEAARSMGLKVKNCRIEGKQKAWNPKAGMAPTPKKSMYVKTTKNEFSCRIKNKGRCKTDERFNVNKSTNAMISFLSTVFWNKDIQQSGSAVQIAMLANNYGFSKGDGSKAKPGIIKAYQNYKSASQNGNHFYGDNITCGHSINAFHPDSFDQKCGGELGVQTQRYGYEVVARYFTAVCYYTENYPKEPAFKPWLAMDLSFCQALQTPKKKSLGF